MMKEKMEEKPFLNGRQGEARPAAWTNLYDAYEREDEGEEVKSMQVIRIDTDFDFRKEAGDRDIDAFSPTLRAYHQRMWSKELPNGKRFELTKHKAPLLYHESELGRFHLSSDTIARSYRLHQKSKGVILEQIPREVQELYAAVCKVAAYIIFPSKQVNGQLTINSARGWNFKIDDRFDLTLECIRRFYSGEGSPLHEALSRYRDFFALFQDFKGYSDFFLLQDLVSDDYSRVKFYLPFINFVATAKTQFHTIDDYLLYKKAVMKFLKLRTGRIEKMYNP
jgi:hypothetical protein